MIIQWSDVQCEPNIAYSPGRQCSCGAILPHEHLHVFAASDGRRLNVKRVQTGNLEVLVFVDA